MPSSYSTNLKIELQATGENSGTWGTITNTNLGTALEQAVVGYGNPSYATDANLTLTYTDTNAAQAARALVLNVTSAVSLTATRELIVPTIQKQYIVQNNTTGSQSITVKTSGGTGITVTSGRKAHLYVNGTDVIFMDDFVDINGGAIDGTTIGASSAAAGTFTTLGATTGNITTVNATTVDTTNIEVTNLKAKDGTAAGSIADSTGVVTLASSVLTTTDINGGTIDGTTIGGSSAAAGTFTTLTTSSTVTLNGGTANGVLYLNGSKVATSGSALTFDGTNFGLGTNTLTYTFNVAAPTARANYTSTTGTNTVWQNHANTGGNFYIGIENSAGTTFGTTAYSSVLWSTGSTPIVFATSGAEQMRLTSTGLGIGTTTPYARLQVLGTIKVATGNAQGILALGEASGSTVNCGIWRGSANAPTTDGNFLNFGGYEGIVFAASNNVIGSQTERMRLDSSGNLGLGVTPSAWDTLTALQVKNAHIGGVVDNAYFGANCFYNGVNWTYIATNEANRIELQSGKFEFYTAASGTAGNAISFTQAMTLTAAGDLLIGSTTDNHKLSVIVQSGADREIFFAAIAGSSNGFRVQWKHSTLKTHVSISNIPTSSAGLPGGTLYSDGGTIKIA